MIPITLLSAGLSIPPAHTPLFSQVECAEIVITEGVTFRPGSARVRRSERRVLEELAGVLNTEPAPILLLSVEGYQAVEERREGLALARALAVNDALLDLGVHASRLVPLGHDLPLYWSGDLEALGEHRVEFHVLLDNTCDTE
ncbi:MAG: OmpA family protein [Myxococcota bacterium]|nr:OmpA family protein [Myxococcota bacterium]